MENTVTTCGKDYVCCKDYKVGNCSYTKGNIYHSSRDGYLDDDLGVSWSCSKDWFDEYMSELKPTEMELNYNVLTKNVLKNFAMSFIIWLDNNTKIGNMCLSNMECEDIEKAFISVDWSKIYRYIKKKVDNVREPKFKPGNYVVNNKSNDIFIVKEIKENEYLLSPLDGVIEGYLYIDDVDLEYRKWSLSDAKDGDILVCEDCAPFMFNGIVTEENHPCAYFGIDDCGELTISGPYIEGVNCCWTFDDVLPATKQQSELLMNELKFNGYVFDFENKKLKKVSDYKKDWTELDEDRLEKCIRLIKNSAYTTVKEEYESIEWLKSIKERYNNLNNNKS